jgi:catechol 2,3-dioxygenase-like lactoylglutathione lyase family enzyme
MSIEIHHVSILTDDIDTSIDFYRNNLGMQLGTRFFQKDTADIAFLYDGPASTRYAVQLIGPPFGGWMKEIFQEHGPSMGHHAFKVTDLEGWRAKLESAGVEVLEPPKPFLTYKHMYFKDASGTVVELVEYPGAEFSPRPQERTASPSGIDYYFNHISILCNDLAELERFYIDHFGMQNVFDRRESGYILVADPVFLADERREAVTLEIMGPEAEYEREQAFLAEHGPGLDHTCYVVDDVDVAHADLVARGVEFPYPPEDAGTNRLAFFKDPSGVDVELMLSIPRSRLTV